MADHEPERAAPPDGEPERPEDERRSVAKRLSPLLARGGWVAVPSLLLEHQGRLGLSTAELTYVLHVLRFRWGEEWPWVRVADVAAAAGVHVEVARRWKRRLMQSPQGSPVKYLRCTERVDRSGRGPDLHDLSGLFARLEALVLEREARKAVDRVRGDLPEPTFHRGPSTIPPLSTAPPHDSAGTGPGESVGGHPT